MWMYIRPLTLFKSLLAIFWQSFMVGHYFCPVPACLFSRECRFPGLPQRQCGQLVLITFGCESSLYVNYHLAIIVITVCKLPSGNHANQYRASNYWKYCLIIRSWAFSEGDVGNYSSVTVCHLKIPAPYSWEQQSYSGVTWASIYGHHIKIWPCHFLYPDAKEFSPSVQVQDWAAWTNWTSCVCSHGPNTFNCSWISPQTSRAIATLTLDHHGCRNNVGRQAPN